MDNRPIGVFDSGIGGLTVVSSVVKALPNEDIYYVGDTARVPYGNKSKKNIQKFSYQIANWLVKQNCKIIVVACNTVSSLALQKLKTDFSIPIIGVIEPAVNHAISSTANYNIGILGTQATIKSDAYKKCIISVNSNINIISQACPLFVPLVEEGWVHGKIPSSVASVYLKKIKDTNVDTVILGCTHYPLLKDIINKELGNKTRLIDSGESTANIVTSVLNNKKLRSKEKKGNIYCFVTDAPKSFDTFAEKLLKKKMVKTKKIELF